MALFQVFKGDEAGLDAVPKHEGYAYFTEDQSNFFIDIKSDINGTGGVRKQLNALAAKKLIKGDGTFIEVSDLLLKSMTLDVEHGGTGATSLTANAILLGNGTGPVKLVTIEEGALALGDTANGLSSLKGVGALYALTAGAPQFGTLPVSAGGTGATTEAAARTNLGVDSSGEVDTKVASATTVGYTTTLAVAGWTSTADGFEYNYANTSIQCGKNGDIMPIITYTSNKDEWSKVDSADATKGVGIVFRAKTKPANDIGIAIIDVH